MVKHILAVHVLLTALAVGQTYLGRLDTIGCTTYDWQTGESAVKCLVNAPEHGLHAVWMWSLETSGTAFTDRNMRYNYYDFATRRWMQPDSNPMNGGAGVYTHRAGYGNIDYDPANGAAVVVAHYTGNGGGVTPKMARDAEPGAGIFDFADGEEVLGVTQWPRVVTGQNGTIHILCMTAGYAMTYSRILPGNWPVFEPPISVGPSPGFPCFNMAASKVSGKVSLAWVMEGSLPQHGFVQNSMDNGETWPWLVVFPPPDAYGGDTVSSFHSTSLYPWYDWEDRLHIVANVMPVVNDTSYIMPSQIWHYCPDNTPEWNRIHVASCNPYNVRALPGYNGTYACRPSIGEGNDGRLYVTWEQFDSANVEPLTNLLRAGIWASSSPDNGVTWSPGVLLTERNTFSHRFPSVVDRMVSGGASGDTVCVLYMIDSVAGFYVQSQGPASYNPMVCQFVPSSLIGVQESPKPQVPNHKLAATVLAGASGVRRLASSVVYDAMGRRVLDPKPGVYFIGEGLGTRGQGLGRIRKVVVTR